MVKAIQVSEPAVKWMRYKAGKMYPNENGRGADKYVENKLLPRIKKTIQETLSSASRTSSPPFHVDIRYRKNDLEINVI